MRLLDILVSVLETFLSHIDHLLPAYLLAVVASSGNEIVRDLGPFTGALTPRQAFPRATEYKETTRD